MPKIPREQHELMYTCVYCGKLMTEFPCKGMPDGRRAHLECYIDHIDEEEKRNSYQEFMRWLSATARFQT